MPPPPVNSFAAAVWVLVLTVELQRAMEPAGPGGGKSQTFRAVANAHIREGVATSLADLQRITSPNAAQPGAGAAAANPAAAVAVSVRLVTDGAQQFYTPGTGMWAALTRRHYTREKANRKKANRNGHGQLQPADVDAALWPMQQRMANVLSLRRIVGATDHLITVELTPGQRFPKYRAPVKPSDGDLGRVCCKLAKDPQAVTDGRHSSTLPDKVVQAAWRGRKDPTNTMGELILYCVPDDERQRTSVCNVLHGDAFFFDPADGGVQVVHTTDRDGLISLAFAPEPRPGTWLVVTEFDAATGRVCVADALVAHDALVRTFLPKFAQLHGDPLVFARSLPAEPSDGQLRVWLAGMFVLCQNGATDTGARLRHRAKEGTDIGTVGAPCILRQFDAFAAAAKEPLLTFDGFQHHCEKHRTRLGGAARLEDNGKPWNEYRIQLAFAGHAILAVTRQLHGLDRWLAFLGVNKSDLQKFSEVRAMVIPDAKALHDMKRVVLRDDLTARTASNFVDFVAGVCERHEEQRVAYAAVYERRRPRPDAIDQRCVDAKYVKAGKFAVAMPVTVDKMDISSDADAGADSDFVEEMSVSSDDDVADLNIVDNEDHGKRLMGELEKDFAVELKDVECAVADGLLVRSDDEELENVDNVEAVAKKPKKKIKKGTAPRRGRRGDYIKEQDVEPDEGGRKRKPDHSEYFAENLGSLAGQGRYWAKNTTFDVAKALAVAHHLKSTVGVYVERQNSLVDVLLGVAATLASTPDAIFPILSNDFWISVLQANLLLDVPVDGRLGQLPRSMDCTRDNDGISFMPRGGGKRGITVWTDNPARAVQQLAAVIRVEFERVAESAGRDELLEITSSVTTSVGYTASIALGNLIGMCELFFFILHRRRLIQHNRKYDPARRACQLAYTDRGHSAPRH